MSPPISREVTQLVQSLFEKRSLLERVRGQDGRLAILKRIAATREIRVVPNLLPLMTTDDALARQVARAIAEVVRDVTPEQLSWLDEQVRHNSYGHYWSDAWYQLAPSAVPRLAQRSEFDGADSISRASR